MIKKLPALLLGLFLLSQTHAAIADDDNPYGIPTEWFACKTTDDCGKVKNPCGYLITVVQKARADDALTLICKNHPDHAALCMMGCIQTQPMRHDSTEVLCDEGRCVLKPIKK